MILTNYVHALQEYIAEDVIFKITAALYTTKSVAVASGTGCEVFRIQHIIMIPYGKLHGRDLGIVRVFPSTVTVVIHGAINGVCEPSTCLRECLRAAHRMKRTID